MLGAYDSAEAMAYVEPVDDTCGAGSMPSSARSSAFSAADDEADERCDDALDFVEHLFVDALDVAPRDCDVDARADFGAEPSAFQ